MQHGGDTREDMVLATDLFGEMGFEVAEMFETVGCNSR
jgi:hypothetical protein